MSKTLDYHVVISGWADTTDFGIGSTVAYIANPTNLAWTEYINDVGECFFTLSQTDSMIPKLRNDLNQMRHMRIYRNGQLVWGGWLGETDETPEDVIIYGYNYLSGLYMLHSDWNQEWTNENVGDIISDLWTRANSGITGSRMGWMGTGTIQNPVTTSGGAVDLTLPLYKVYYKRILSAMQELVAYSISDTTNHVVFEITPGGTFNLWKDLGSSLSNVTFAYGDGAIRHYRRLRVPIDRRTALLAVGSSPIGATLREEVTAAANISAYGRLEEAIYFSWVKNSTQLGRVARARLQRAKRIDTDLLVTFDRDAIIPARATDSLIALGDDITIDLPKGISSTGSETKMIVGQQVVVTRGSENVRLLLADALA